MKRKTDIGFICQFAVDDFKSKYAGSLLGFMWAFAQPIITIVIYWFVFQIGFKNEDVDGVPFILWLVSGIIPWLFMSDAIINSSSSMVEYSYLVKKVVFNIDILPIARIIAVFFIQLVLLAFTFVLYIAYGVIPTIHVVQLFYYVTYSIIICIGIAYFTSALYVFFKDILQLISVILQLIFWFTPIVWRIDIMPNNIQNILRFNPIFYVINGYRDSFVQKRWFFECSIGYLVYYWIIALFILGIGIFTFHRLKPHFADVL